MSAPTNVLDELARDEGFRPTVYKDSRGYWTVGIGLCIDPAVPGSGMSLAEAEAVLKLRLQSIDQHLQQSLPWYKTLDPVRSAALLNMTYNLGYPHLVGFHDFLGHLSRGEYDQAADAMFDSLWAKQVGDRARRLAQQIKTGQWQ